jgi:ribosomal protein S18 acetylase RimI-like enzyme
MDVRVTTDPADGVIELMETDEDGSLLGRAVLEPADEGAWLGLEIVPEVRNRHHGRHLLERALEEARLRDLGVVRIAFERGDQAALALIHGCGHPSHSHCSGGTCTAEITVG